MPETPTPAQDLAALDRVTELAARFDLATPELTGILACLRAAVATERHLTDSLGRAFMDAGGPVGRGWPRDLGTAIVRAIASVGARIVWPSPETAETPDRGSADDTAPETTSSDVVSSSLARYGRMYHTYATRHFGFPALPTAGDVHTAEDGSRWEFERDADHGYWVRISDDPTFMELIRERIVGPEVAALAKVPVVVLPDGHIAYRMDLWWREIGPDGRDRGNLIALPPGARPLTEAAAYRMDGAR